MSRVCHECGKNVENPFYEVSAVVRGSREKLAFSSLSVSLCYKHYQVVERHLVSSVREISSDIGFVIDGVTGEFGELTRSVQISSKVYDRHGQYSFLNKEEGLRLLPKSAQDLIRGYSAWVRKTKNGDWKRVDWAQAIFEREMKDQTSQ